MNKVTGLLGGREEKQMMDRGLWGRTKGGPLSLSGVLRQLTPQELQSIPPVHCCLLTFTDRNHFAVEWIDYLPSQPMLAPSQCPSVCLCVPVVNFITMCLSGSHPLVECVLNDMYRTLQDHTRKNIPLWYMEHIESALCCLGVCPCTPACTT